MIGVKKMVGSDNVGENNYTINNTEDWSQFWYDNNPFLALVKPNWTQYCKRNSINYNELKESKIWRLVNQSAADSRSEQHKLGSI